MKSSSLLVLCVSYLAITCPPLLIGCIDDGTSGTSTSSSSGSTSGDAGTTASSQECDDLATAYANAEVRCGQGDFAALKSSFIASVAGGDCRKAIIREPVQLESTCVPSLSSISCDDLLNARVDPSCAQQISF